LCAIHPTCLVIKGSLLPFIMNIVPHPITGKVLYVNVIFIYWPVCFSLSKTNQDKILNDYYRLVYGEGMGCDPYKQIVYKVIGRCELHRMSLPIESSQDDIWLQVNLYFLKKKKEYFRLT
jgi:hypothetical protein